MQCFLSGFQYCTLIGCSTLRASHSHGPHLVFPCCNMEWQPACQAGGSIGKKRATWQGFEQRPGMPASREALFQGNAHATGPVPLLVTEWHSPIVEYRTSQQHSIARHLLNSFHSIWHKDQREALLTWRIVFLVSVQPISTIEYWKYLWCLGCSSERGYTTIMLQGLWLIAAFVLLTSCWLHKEYSVCYSLWPAKCHGFNRLWSCASAFISLSFLLMYLEGACMFQKVHHHTCFNKLFCNHVCVDIKLHGRVQFWKARRPSGNPLGSYQN